MNWFFSIEIFRLPMECDECRILFFHRNDNLQRTLSFHCTNKFLGRICAKRIFSDRENYFEYLFCHYSIVWCDTFFSRKRKKKYKVIFLDGAYFDFLKEGYKCRILHFRGNRNLWGWNPLVSLTNNFFSPHEISRVSFYLIQTGNRHGRLNLHLVPEGRGKWLLMHVTLKL